ncbi:putative Ig domain-containing protein [Nocardioides aquiterrae]|uniref:Ig-like domain repeat protein n=1 Tax=Nocardioides aquiterrae TaxID=203799 RepID=A0ABN1UDI5_9ACTN
MPRALSCPRLLTVLALAVASLVVTPVRADAADTTVTTYDELAAAFAAGGTVVLAADIAASSSLATGGGGVTLDLNGHALTLHGAGSYNAGIGVAVGNPLTVTDSSPGAAGVLDTWGGDSSPGLGGYGNPPISPGLITIAGGTVRAHGGYDAAGIGGGIYQPGATVIVSGGRVEATGGDRGAGIGIGFQSHHRRESAGTVTVTGGTVVAQGGVSGAGIGGGDAIYQDATSRGGDGATVTITGGSVVAQGGSGGAGVGGGSGSGIGINGGSGGAVTVSGGTLEATGGQGAAGVGGGRGGLWFNSVVGDGGSGGTVAVSGDGVLIARGSAATSIGGGKGQDGPGDFGSLTSSGTVVVPAGAALTIPAGVTVDNAGTLRVAGDVNGAGTLRNSGRVERSATEALTTPLSVASVTGHHYLLEFDSLGVSDPEHGDLLVYADTVEAAHLAVPIPPTPAPVTFAGWATDAGTSVGDGTSLSALVAGHTADSPRSTLALRAGYDGPPAFTGLAGDTAFTIGTAGSVTLRTLAGPAATLSVEGSLPAGVTFTDRGDGTADIAGTPASGTAGSYPLTVTASNGRSPDATHDLVITVERISQDVRITGVPSLPLVEETFTPTVAGGASGNPVTLASTGACTVADDVVTFTRRGECTVTASQAGDDRYAPGSDSWTATVTGTAQSVAFTTSPATMIPPFPYRLADYVGASYVPAATATSGLPVFLNAVGEGCSWDGTTVTFVARGRCFVFAEQAGNDQYEPADSDQVITVLRGTPQIVFGSTPPSDPRIGGTYTPAATATSGETTSFAVSGGCTLDQGTVTFQHAGTCTLTASTAGSYDYYPTDAAQRIEVARDPQTLAFTSAPPTSARVGEGYAVSATSTASDLPVAFSANQEVCSVSGRTVLLTAAGTCTITAIQAGDGDRLPAAEVTQSFPVSRRLQQVTFTSMPPSEARIGDTYTVGVNAGASGQPVTLTTSSECTVSGRQVTLLHAGACVITAAQAGDANHEPAPPALQVVRVRRTPQVLSFASTPPTPARIGGIYAPQVTGGVAARIVLVAGGSCELVGQSVTFTHAGGCTVTAQQAGDDDHAPADPVSQQITVERLDSRLTVAVRGGRLVAELPVGSGLPAPQGDVRFAVDGVDVGSAPLVSAGGGIARADLDHQVPNGGRHRVSAEYDGGADYRGAAADVVRDDPTIVATVTSALPANAAGWYRTPVTVRFVCTATTGALLDPCPDPVVVDASDGDRVVTGTVRAADGGTASARVDGLHVDSTRPKVRIDGVPSGIVDRHPLLAVVCTDRVSDVRTCRLTRSRERVRADVVTWTYEATATDEAGNARRTTAQVLVRRR